MILTMSLKREGVSSCQSTEVTEEYTDKIRLFLGCVGLSPYMEKTHPLTTPTSQPHPLHTLYASNNVSCTVSDQFPREKPAMQSVLSSSSKFLSLCQLGQWRTNSSQNLSTPSLPPVLRGPAARSNWVWREGKVIVKFLDVYCFPN